MAEEAKDGVEESLYAEFVQQVLQPKRFDSFRTNLQGESFAPIQIIFHENPANPEEVTSSIELDDFFPTMTLGDLQTRIYIEKDEFERYHPQNQCLLHKVPKLPLYRPLQYLIEDKYLDVLNPLEYIQDSDLHPTFVKKDGTILYVKDTQHERMTLFSKFFENPPKTTSGMYEIHLFLFDDIISLYSGARPIGPEMWAGKFMPYFPARKESQELEDMTERVQRYKDREKLFLCLETLLRDKELRQPGVTGRGDPLQLSTFRMLRIGWHRPKEDRNFGFLQLENLFFGMPLSEIIPYVRFFPKNGVPLSKVFVKGPFNMPALDRPDILSRWAQEQSRTPDDDLLLLKVLLRRASGSVPPLYGTFYIFENGSAKFILQPNEKEKALSRQIELYQLREILSFVTKAIPKQQPLPTAPKQIQPRVLFTPQNVYLDEAYVVFSMWLESTDTPITPENLKNVLPFFLPFFQITSSPVPEQNPLFFLRFKGVDNFRTSSRDFQFLKTILDLQIKENKVSVPALKRFYSEHFDVNEKVAEQRVSAFLTKEMTYQLTNPELLEFKPTENPGIDIALFGTHPLYTIHLYRVDDLYTLHNVLTALSLFISVTPEDFTMCESSAEREFTEQKKDSLLAEKEALALTMKVSQDTVADQPLTQTVLSTQPAEIAGISPEEFDDDLDEILGSGFLGMPKQPSVVVPEVSYSPSQQEQAAAEIPLTTLLESDAPSFLDTKGSVSKAIPSSSELKKVVAKTYFNERLQLFDKELFSYPKAPGVKEYPRMCGAAALRQPTVMTEDSYKRMREIYKKDEEEKTVEFFDFPLPEGKRYEESHLDTRVRERITSLRYGTPGKSNIYICSQFWCVHDEIVVLQKDFVSKRDRNGNPKPSNTCPFCYGRLITLRDEIEPGATVIERTQKDKAEGRHLFVQFLKTSQHPGGFSLPCCFLKDKALYDNHPAFKKQEDSKLILPQKMIKDSDAFVSPRLNKPITPSKEEEEEAETEEGKFADELTPFHVNYDQRLADMKRSPYITGPEKFPLDIKINVKGDKPQIGVLSPALDKYFSQRSIPDLVKQDHTVWRLMTNNEKEVVASGFFRMAVDNRKPYQAESFFAAVAPILGFNSTYALKQAILGHMNLNIFLQLNYGNFLLEFYDPNFKIPGVVPQKMNQFLTTFVTENLIQGIFPGPQTESILRAAKAWFRFQEVFSDIQVIKEYRQFAPFFAAPGFFRENGILFVVLETDKSGVVTVRCPPYGISEEMARRCDIAFVSYTPSAKVWEPIFYSKNDPSTGTHDSMFVFTSNSRASWPPIVRARVEEYYSLCKSSGLGIYTDSPGVNPKTLIPLRKALTLPLGENMSVYSVLRDAYNHISAVLYELDEKEKYRCVYVHVIDDGSLHRNVRYDFDWENNISRLAKRSVVEDFYQTYILPVARELGPEVENMYTPDLPFISERAKKDGKYNTGLMLKGGLAIPIAKTMEEMDSYTKKDYFPWQIDKHLVFGEEEASVSLEMDPKTFQEIFQHLRLTFSNWFTFEATKELKDRVRSILFDVDGYINRAIPLWQKRAMMRILLGPIVLSWLDASRSAPNRLPSLRRIDCHLQRTSETCSNFCSWKQDENKCLLHTPENILIGQNMVPAREVLFERLIEQLLRFPIERQQLLENRVRQYQTLRDGFRSGNEYIVSENLPAWTELLRKTWQEEKTEQPKFVEELQSGLVDYEKKDEVLTLPVLPPVLKTLFGKKEASFFFFPIQNSVLEVLGDFQLSLFGFVKKFGLVKVFEKKEQFQWVAEKLPLSIVMLFYEHGNDVTPPLIVGASQQPKLHPYLVFVQLPNGQLGVLSSSYTEVQGIPFKMFSTTNLDFAGDLLVAIKNKK